MKKENFERIVSFRVIPDGDWVVGTLAEACNQVNRLSDAPYTLNDKDVEQVKGSKRLVYQFLNNHEAELWFYGQMIELINTGQTPVEVSFRVIEPSPSIIGVTEINDVNPSDGNVNNNEPNEEA